MSNLNENLERARLLLSSFEKKCSSLFGAGELSEALQLLDEISNVSDNDQAKGKAYNLISLYSRFAMSKINSLLKNPKEHRFETIDYWGKVIDEFIPFTGVEFVSAQETLSRIKSDAAWEKLSNKKQEKRIISAVNSLSSEERRTLFERLKKRNETKTD